MKKNKDQIAEEWYELINQEFYAFRGDSRKTISNFAEWLEFPQGQLSQYMQKGGRVPQGLTVINRFARKLGPKVYLVLDMPIPEDPIDSLPEPTRTIAREIRDSLAEYKLSPDSAEAAKLQDEILKKHGYDLISSKD